MKILKHSNIGCQQIVTYLSNCVPKSNIVRFTLNRDYLNTVVKFASNVGRKRTIVCAFQHAGFTCNKSLTILCIWLNLTALNLMSAVNVTLLMTWCTSQSLAWCQKTCHKHIAGSSQWPLQESAASWKLTNFNITNHKKFHMFVCCHSPFNFADLQLQPSNDNWYII